jgi:hypothetical protein
MKTAPDVGSFVCVGHEVSQAVYVVVEKLAACKVGLVPIERLPRGLHHAVQYMDASYLQHASDAQQANAIK